MKLNYRIPDLPSGHQRADPDVSGSASKRYFTCEYRGSRRRP
jgi:hypothetical protein